MRENDSTDDKTITIISRDSEKGSLLSNLRRSLKSLEEGWRCQIQLLFLLFSSSFSLSSPTVNGAIMRSGEG